MSTLPSDFRDTLDRRRPARVLLLSTVPNRASSLQAKLDGTSGERLEIREIATAAEVLEALAEERCEALLLDLAGREVDRLAPLIQTREAFTRLPIIVLSDRDDTSEALLSLRFGAQDYIVDVYDEPLVLRRSLRHAFERHRLVAELLVARHRAQFVATHDALTQLPNRTLLHDQLGRAIAHAARSSSQVAVLFIDLDRFKSINDTLGHAVGDELLVQAGERLAAGTRRGDMVARIGGDEFVVMNQSMGREEGPAIIADRFLARLARPFLLEGREYWISGSIGISVFPRDGLDATELIRNADVALYQAKARGGNAFCFYDDRMNERVRKRLELENRLRRAIEMNELRIAYQPKIEVATGRITGAEALLRWRDSKLGHVAPHEFIPVAEASGLIVRLGEWTIREACRQLGAWREAGLAEGVQVMVNLSPHQIEERDGLRAVVSSALWDASLRPADLALEVTESALMRNEAQATHVLSELRQIGIGISLDDFGTGFSSLGYLKRFPVDTVKIDQGFVRDLAFDPDDAAIVAAVLSIAGQLDLNVVAEGVETHEQCEFLRERGCPEIQGFLYSPPLDGESFAALLRRGVCAPKTPRPV